MQNAYEILGVPPTASDEEIRAAYRALSQQYHPDRNPDDPEAHERMSELNGAYAILSDPNQRKQLDVQIARRRLQIQVAAVRAARLAQTSDSAAPPAVRSESDRTDGDSRTWWVFLVLAIAIGAGAAWWKTAHLSDTAPPAAVHSVQTAPNGQPFPLQAAYISGYPVLRETGGNTISVSAAALTSAIFAQLYELRDGKFTAIRTFYIPAGGTFDLHKIGDGDFSLQYQRTDNGEWQVSDTIQIRNTENAGQYREIKIRL